MSTAAAVAMPGLSSDSTTAAHCAVYTSDLICSTHERWKKAIRLGCLAAGVGCSGGGAEASAAVDSAAAVAAARAVLAP